MSVLLVGCGKSGGESKSSDPASGSGGSAAPSAAVPTDDFKPETERGKTVIADVLDWKVRLCACKDLQCAADVNQKPPLTIGHTDGMTDREKKHLDELMNAVQKCTDALMKR